MTNQDSSKPLVVQITTVPQTLYSLFPNVVKHLKESGFEVRGISSTGGELSYKDAADKLGIEVATAPLTRKISPLGDIKALFALVKLLKNWKPDVVHCHTPKAGLLGGLAAWFAGVPCRLYTVRGLPHVTATGLTRMLLVNSERLACSFAQRVIVVSKSVMQELADCRIGKQSKMKVACSGAAQGVEAKIRFNPANVDSVETNRIRNTLGIPENSFVIGFVGRLTVDKGIEQLHEVWQTIRAKHPNAHLIMIGPDNEPRGNVVETINTLRKDDRVHFTGRVKGIEKYLSAMDLFLFPSHREGFSNAVLEASAMSLPTIAFDAVGCRDGVQDGVTGFIVPLKDVEMMTDRLTHLMNDRVLCKQFGENARHWVLKDFDPRDRVLMIENEYRDLLSQL